MLKSRLLYYCNLLPRSPLLHSATCFEYRSIRNVGFTSNLKKSYTLVVIGGGSAGISIAARFANYLKILKKGTVAVVEPQNVRLIYI